MQKVLILGAGKIGALISGLLAECRRLRRPRRRRQRRVAQLGRRRPTASPTCTPTASTPRDPAALEAHLRAHPVDAVISSLPFYCNVEGRRGRAQRPARTTST